MKQPGFHIVWIRDESKSHHLLKFWGECFMGEGSSTAFPPAAGQECAKSGMEEEWCRAKQQRKWCTRKSGELAGKVVLFSETPRIVPCQYPVFILIDLFFTSFSKKFVGKYHGNHQMSAKCSFCFSPLIPSGNSYPIFILGYCFRLHGNCCRYNHNPVNVFISIFKVTHARKMFMLQQLENLSKNQGWYLDAKLMWEKKIKNDFLISHYLVRKAKTESWRRAEGWKSWQSQLQAETLSLLLCLISRRQTGPHLKCQNLLK